MQFFTSPEDLKKWVESFKSADEASLNIMNVIGKNEEQDIVQSCRSIYDNKDESAAKILFGILAKHNITQIREGKMKDKLVKQSQAVMRTDALYSHLDMRICPKLPKQSAGQGLISTYNCRTYCLDSIVLDDDPNRVYCAEAMWRRHVMDKFSREFKDKDGKWVGGYINQRFQVFRDDGGNQMELAHGERTRKPRPHQFSTERRLEEARGEETTDLTASTNKSNKIVKLAFVDAEDSKNYQIFNDMIEMKESGLSDEDIIYKVAEHYNMPIPTVANVYRSASKMMERYDGIVYSNDNGKLVKIAQEGEGSDPEQYPLFSALSPELKAKAMKIWAGQLDKMEEKYIGQRTKLIQDLLTASSDKTIKTAQMSFPEKTTLITKKDMQVQVVDNGQESTLKMETPVVVVSNGNNPVFHVTSGPAAGVNFTLKNANDMVDGFGLEDEGEDKIQEGAEELGLNESMSPKPSDQTSDFPIIEN